MTGYSETFRFDGMYRVQSRCAYQHSELEGRWIARDPSLIEIDAVNAGLERSDLWLGRNIASVKSAFVTFRSGAFREPDALYYCEAFISLGSSDPFTSDVIDVSKLQDLWTRRRKYVASLFGDQFESLESLTGDIVAAANNEYHCHEAGHLLGWDIKSKYASGYFRVGGKTLWPLIYTEEHRADLHSLAFALNILPTDRAISVFLYQVLHRFGLAMESTATNGPDAGPIPFFLFCTLLHAGCLSVSDTGFRLKSISADSLAHAMQLCGDRARGELTALEMSSRSAIDIAINAARYYRGMASDVGAFETFANAMRASICRCTSEPA
jgi:hypothetical protein